ncbi:hypothetical protein G6F35_015068 [Rhizopus arrhizus]|nr:hypothetical protein G6F35_015068 [Rhizopus arrhizus]
MRSTASGMAASRLGRGGLPGDQQVGAHGGHAFGVGLGAVADDGQLPGGGGIVAAADGRDEAVTRAGGIDEFGGVGRQGDGAARGRSQQDRAAFVVMDLDGGSGVAGGGRRMGQRRAQGQEQPGGDAGVGACEGHAGADKVSGVRRLYRMSAISSAA